MRVKQWSGVFEASVAVSAVFSINISNEYDLDSLNRLHPQTNNYR